MFSSYRELSDVEIDFLNDESDAAWDEEGWGPRPSPEEDPRAWRDYAPAATGWEVSPADDDLPF